MTLESGSELVPCNWRTGWETALGAVIASCGAAVSRVMVKPSQVATEVEARPADPTESWWVPSVAAKDFVNAGFAGLYDCHVAVCRLEVREQSDNCRVPLGHVDRTADGTGVDHQAVKANVKRDGVGVGVKRGTSIGETILVVVGAATDLWRVCVS